MSKYKLLLGLCVLFFAQEGCHSKSDQKTYGHVHVALRSQVRGLDPAAVGDDSSVYVVSQIYEPLYQYSYLERPVKLQPVLAEGLPEISKDGLVYTIKIKKGILFQDDPCFVKTGGKGREVTANDFIFSWMRLGDPKVNSDETWIRKVIGMAVWRENASKSGSADYSASVPGFELIDSKTLKIKLSEVHPELSLELAKVQNSVLPKEAIQLYGVEITSHPVGTGPYVLKEWVRHSQISLERNPHYHDEFYPAKGEVSDETLGLLRDAGKKLPLNDGAIITDGSLSRTTFLNFLSGNLDSIEDVPTESFKDVVTDNKINKVLAEKGMNLGLWEQPSNFHFYFNMEDPILGKNKLLRKAIERALNVEDIVARFRNGAGKLAIGPIPPGIEGCDTDKSDPNLKYDLATAKDHLAKAGYPNGKGLPKLSFEIRDTTDSRQLGEYFQIQMAKIGINVQLNQNTWPAFVDKLFAGNFQTLIASSSADTPDGYFFLASYYSKNRRPGPNRVGYSNKVYDDLYKRGSEMKAGPQRNSIACNLVHILVDDVPSIFMYNRVSYTLTQGWLKNLKPYSMVANNLKYQRVDADLKRKLKDRFH